MPDPRSLNISEARFFLWGMLAMDLSALVFQSQSSGALESRARFKQKLQRCGGEGFGGLKAIPLKRLTHTHTLPLDG